MNTPSSIRLCPYPGVPTWVTRGAYMVHPEAAAPSGTMKLARTHTVATTYVQNESMLRKGKAMSRAPICRGISRLPKPPIMMGVIAQKIMISP